MKALHIAADAPRLSRIRALVRGGRILAAQKAILPTMTLDEKTSA